MNWDQDEPDELDEREARRAQLQREIEETEADNEARRQRRLLGEERQWRVPEPEPSLVQREVKAESAKIRKEIASEIEHLASIVGEECGTNERKLRQHFEQRIDDAVRNRVTRADIDTVRRELNDAVDRIRVENRDAAARSASKLLELREIRESAMHDLQKQIFEIQREVFLLRQALAHERSVGPSKGNGLLTYEHQHS